MSNLIKVHQSVIMAVQDGMNQVVPPVDDCSEVKKSGVGIPLLGPLSLSFLLS